MKEITCDVLVIGAGPAGLSAARAAAMNGAKTICIDKKAVIGEPIQCAEAIGKYLLKLMPFEIPKKLLKHQISTISFTYKNITINRTGGVWKSFAVDRKQFDEWLAKKATSAGSEIWLNSELIDLIEEKDIFNTIIKKNNTNFLIKPKVIIAADGTHSKVRKKLGLEYKDSQIGKIISFEYTNIKPNTTSADQLYMGDFANGGYGYIFPISENKANIGVANIFPKKKLEDHFEDFISLPIISKQISMGKKTKEKSGDVPYYDNHPTYQEKNVLFVGDAANQNIKPLVEGILPAILFGDIAGKVAADPSTNLDKYEEKIKDFDIIRKYSNEIMETAYALFKNQNEKNQLLSLGLSSGLFSPKDVFKLKNASTQEIKKQLNNKNKKLNHFLLNLREKIELNYLYFKLLKSQ